MSYLIIDFETRSPVDIKESGGYRYAEDENTDVMVLSVLSSDWDKPLVWVSPKFRALMVVESELSDIELSNLIDAADIIIAHNAPFERAIWHEKMTKLGFEDLPVNKIVDTAVMASLCGLPRSLEGASAYLCNGDDRLAKDMEGSKIMKKFVKPLQRGKGWYENRDDFVRMMEYCRQDAVATKLLYESLPKFQEGLERDIYVLDQTVNDRGALLDVKSAQYAVDLLADYANRLQDEATTVSDGAITSMKSPKQLKDYLAANGIDIDSVNKESVSYLLSLPDLPSNVRRVLEIRTMLGKSSVAKFNAILACASPRDDRARGLFAFCGAGTGRWAGRLIQLQNLPRPTGAKNAIDPSSVDDDTFPREEDFELLSTNVDAVSAKWKDANTFAADLLRGMIKAPEGSRLLVSDYSAIEARVLAWLAGEDTDLDAFRTGKDIYKVTASGIYGIKYEAVDGGGKGPQRQVGKTAVLACGYAGGVGALERFGFSKIPVSDADFRDTIEEIDTALRPDDIADFLGEHFAFAEEAKEKLLKLYEAGDERTIEFLKEARGKIIVRKWRQTHPGVTSLWKRLIDSSIYATNHEGAFVPVIKERGVGFYRKGRFLGLRLPSGRWIFYTDPAVETKPTPWGGTSTLVYCATVDSVTKKIVRRGLTSSILAENLVQATARDLLANSMIALDKAGYSIVCHIHDEVVAEADISHGSIEDFEKVMSNPPSWAEDLPLKAAGGFESNRYHK